MSDRYIDPAELAAARASAAPPTVIDVRGDDEFASGHIPGALHVPGDQLQSRLSELPRQTPVVTY